MPVNVSNLKKSSLFTPKGHPGLFWVIWIILQLQRAAIENVRIDTINTIDKIDVIYTIDTINMIDTIDTIDTINTIDRISCNNQYKDNWYDRSDQLTLQTSPTQWHHCCFLLRFAWLIKVRIVVVLQFSDIFLVRSSLLRILLLFATQYYNGTHSRGDTAPTTRNGLLLCISRSDFPSWISPTNIILFLCSRSYLLQQGGSDNHFKCHSRWWS